MSDKMSDDVFSGITSVSKKWKEAKRQADRHDRISTSRMSYLRYHSHRTTIKEVVYQELKNAYNIVSDNGRYYANARQLFYKVRPKVIELTGNQWTNSSYFTQTLLKDYIEAYSPSWKVVWDARGHIQEPHTDETIGLGGIEVGEYIHDWENSFDQFPATLYKSLINTKGPELRYGAVLFVEKEGFNEILDESGIREEYDIGIMSTKGVPVGASCKLANALSNKGVKIFVLHDFDFAGFKIINTLRHGTRLAPSTPGVIDLGLRLQDIQSLESEGVSYNQYKDPKIMMRRYGCTEEECSFLAKDRVELNAMTSGQFIDFIRKKLDEYKVQKVIPDDQILSNAYTRAVYCQRIDAEIETIKEDLQKDIEIPKDLKELVVEKMKDKKSSWDRIIWDIVSNEDKE